MNHKISWKDLQSDEQKRRAARLLNDPTFQWNSAASHSTVDQFRARQEARCRAAQSKPASNVTVLRTK